MSKAAGADIEFYGVSKAYGLVRVLHDFSLHIRAAEFLTLLGASGSGKSTILNALAGFAPADAGDIRIGGRSIVGVPPEQRNLGMVFQNYSLFPHMSVFDNVAFPLRMRRVDRREIERAVTRALDIVRLSGFARRMPRELSGGQQQRVALARAIVFEPPVLLMDEPLGALDLKLREALQFEIKEIQHEIGCTVLYVTHDQREALAMSSRIVVLREGQIEQVGTPSEMYDHPRTRFVAQFIGQTNILAASPIEGGISLPELGVSYFGPPPSPSERLCASVRPEALRRRPAAAADITLDVTVQEAVFLGDIVEYSARHDGGAEFHFRETRRDRGDVVGRGTRVRLALSPADIVLIPEA